MGETFYTDDMNNYNFGKLIDGHIEYAPSPVIKGDVQIITDDPNVMLALGWKRIVRTPSPISEIVFSEHYIEDESSITIEWREDLTATKNKVLAQITAYDESNNVNGFFLNDVEIWKDHNDRTALERAVDKWEADGHTTYVLCDEKLGKVEVPIATMRQIFKDVEVYAIKCFQNTFEHKQNVLAATTCDDVINYDFTTGYPEKPRF